MDDVNSLEQALHAARALVLTDLAAGHVARAEVVSLVEESVAHRRWWVEQWPEGAAYVAGLVAQDVQDALMERFGRWPLCPACGDTDPHALDVEPELGPNPHWVCGKVGLVVAAVGSLGSLAELGTADGSPDPRRADRDTENGIGDADDPDGLDGFDALLSGLDGSEGPERERGDGQESDDDGDGHGHGGAA